MSILMLILAGMRDHGREIQIKAHPATPNHEPSVQILQFFTSEMDSISLTTSEAAIVARSLLAAVRKLDPDNLLIEPTKPDLERYLNSEMAELTDQWAQELLEVK
ncbi:MAG: hypothetical protein ACAH07_05900 [Methylophilaceae bacterium]|nr:hypothetical protein [Methyloradius sp.]